MSSYDYISTDLAGAAYYAAEADHDMSYLDFPRQRRGRSGTASCAGCHDPTCGCMDRENEWEDGDED